MINKKFILNADDFGLTHAHNQAVLEGYVNGYLRSASLCANGVAFDNAVNDILPDCPDLSVGVHLNIMEGRALTDCYHLINDGHYFNKGYIHYLLKQNKVEIIDDMELEFRAQIEKICCYVRPTHIDSHVHIHSIPAVFELVCKLAEEYNIPYVRTQHEELAFVPKFEKHLKFGYPLNLIKLFLLQYLTKTNRETIDRYDVYTNDFLLGVGYSGMMDAETIEYGLKAIEEESVTEAIIHPCKYSISKKDSHTKEFSITQNMNLKETIEKLGFELINYNDLQ